MPLLEDYHWIAIHSDKTVEKPNYVDINRDTLESFTIYQEKNGKIVHTFTNPSTGKFKIAQRLRSTGSPTIKVRDGKLVNEVVPFKRVIVVYDGAEYHIIDSDYKIVRTTKLKKLDMKIFEFFTNLGEEE